MLCRTCASELPAGSAFCNRCGAAQASEPAGLPAPSPAASQPEVEVWSGRYSLRAAASAWCGWGAWIALVVGARLTLWDFDLGLGSGNGVALAVALSPGLWIVPRALLRVWSLRYRLTSHRLFTERGILAKQHDELELIRVDDISVRQSLLERLFGVGTVRVLSTDASNPELRIEGIRAPLPLKEEIRSQVRARRARTTFLESL